MKCSEEYLKKTIDLDQNHLNHNNFEYTFKKYYVPLCEYCYGITGEKNISEDLVQDAFVYFWKNRDIIKINTSLKSYLYSSVRNGALNHLKKQALERKHNPLIVEFIDELQNSNHLDEELREIQKIKKVLGELPEQCRRVFLMSCVDGLKYKEIAEDLNISVNTVKTHISKAYRLIRENIDHKPEFMLLVVACRMFHSTN